VKRSQYDGAMLDTSAVSNGNVLRARQRAWSCPGRIGSEASKVSLVLLDRQQPAKMSCRSGEPRRRTACTYAAHRAAADDADLELVDAVVVDVCHVERVDGYERRRGEERGR